MDKKENLAEVIKPPQKKGPGLFVFSIIFSICTVSIGLIIDNEIFSRVMFYIQQKALPPFNEVYPYQLLLTMLFAFGLPLGMAIAFIFVIKKTEQPSKYANRLIFASFGILAIVIITPGVLGRELNKLLFAMGGFSILLSVLLTYWFASNFRSSFEKEERIATDLKLLGYLCFGIVTWQVCSYAATPSYSIYPEKMVELEVRPFAIGQLKSIMIYFVVGWILTAVGHYKSMKNYKSK